MKLIVTEKPSVAKELATFLGCKTKGNGFIEGNGYIITWAVGHLVGLAMPEEYNPALKKWRKEDIPFIPEKFKLSVIPSTKNQYSIIKELMNSDKVTSIICATDAGREGALIYGYTAQEIGCKKPVERLWLNSMTTTAIKKAMDNLKPISAYKNLLYAAICRSRADYLVGLNATRAFTIKQGQLLNIGRVQTPTLAIIVNREEEITNFKPQDYYEIVADYGNFNGLWLNGKTTRTNNKETAERIKNKVQGQDGTVTDISSKSVEELPPLLYDLTSLQRDGNKMYGLTAKKTLDLAQKLYEGKLITYPRTDSQYLTSDMASGLSALIKKIVSLKQYTAYSNKLVGLSKRVINDKKVSDHHAIIPTGTIKQLSGDEANIYDLIARRFIANYFKKHTYKTTTVVVTVIDENFISKGKVVTELGWRELYTQTNDTILPSVSQGDPVQVIKSEIITKKTKTPSRYTEGSLLSAMEHAGRFIDDKELKEQLKDNGIGTPATRASIIEKLLSTGYITREKKNLLPTQKGIELISLLPEKIKSPELTGEWEKELNAIEKGQADPKVFMEKIKQYTHEIVKLGDETAKQISNINAFGKCPACNNDIFINKSGYGCSNWKNGCKFFIGKIAGKKISENQVKTLITDKKTKVIKGFTSKKGKKFDAILVVNGDRVEFSFEGITQD